MRRDANDPLPPTPASHGRYGSWLRKLVQVEDREITAMLWSCGYFFCVLTSYSMLRPLREQMGIRGKLEDLPVLYTGTMIGMFIAYPLYLALVAKFPRKKFIPFVYRFAILNLVAFFVLMRFTTHETSVRIGQLFFVWLSVFNMFAISVFWSFMADLWRLDQGKRLFGFIAVGGNLGAIAGSGLTVLLAERIGPISLLLLSCVFLEGGVRIVNHLVRICDVQDEFAHRDRVKEAAALASTRKGDVEKIEHGGLFTGVGLVFRSSYLINICLYTAFYTWCSTFLYFEQAHIVKSAIADDAARTKLFGQMDFAVYVISATIQIAFTGRIVKRFGLGFTLMSQPLLSLIAFTSLGYALMRAPVDFPGKALWVVVCFMVALRATNFATSKPAREMLYTVVGREVKYKSKSFIDTFMYRAGDVVSAWSFDRLQLLKLGLPALAFSVIPVTIVWMLTGGVLKRRQEHLSESDARVEVDDLNPEASRA